MNKTFIVSVAVMATMSAAASAQRGRRGGGGNANAGLPVATNTIVKNPNAYYGKQVTVYAGVDHMLTGTAFLVDQWKAVGTNEVEPVGAPVLVVAPYLTNTLDHRHYLIVRGELMKFDTTAMSRVAAEYKLDLGPELWAKFHDQPMLLAASVLNSTYTELSRKPMLPPTPPELALDESMKAISPAFTALRSGAEDAKPDVVAQNAAALMAAFARTETIWDDLGQGSAGQWARDAQDQITAIQHSAASDNWEAARNSAAKLNQLCTNCHATFRDRQDDGSFRIKAGTF